jgi:hypothetical protein
MSPSRIEPVEATLNTPRMSSASERATKAATSSCSTKLKRESGCRNTRGARSVSTRKVVLGRIAGPSRLAGLRYQVIRAARAHERIGEELREWVRAGKAREVVVVVLLRTLPRHRIDVDRRDEDERAVRQRRQPLGQQQIVVEIGYRPWPASRSFCEPKAQCTIAS